MLELRNVQKSYTEPDGSRLAILDIPRFDVAGGEQMVLVGKSGCGKTTLLHTIAGITRADAGEIRIDGIDIAKLSEAGVDKVRANAIGYVFQTFNLLPGFSALENVLLGMSFAGRKHDPNWAEHLLNEVGLGDRLHYKPAKLSVGQQQRVAVARALANRPKLVLADEPTGALDANNAQQVLELIRKLCTEVSASLLLVSHDPQITAQLPRAVTLAELNKV